MNKLKIVAIVFLITLVSGSCKKDYPKDIPDWLKDKIKAMNKESKGKDCVYDLCREVLEYSDGNDTFFWFQPGFTPGRYIVYDFSGNELCTYQPSAFNSCPVLDIGSHIFVREIWREN